MTTPTWPETEALVREAYNWLVARLTGPESGEGSDVVMGDVTLPTVDKMVAGKFSQIFAAIQGRASYILKSEMDAVTPVIPDGWTTVAAQVLGDSVDANNGLYFYDSAASQWVVSSYDVVTLLAQLRDEVSVETQNRLAADNTLSLALSSETANRVAGDGALQSSVAALQQTESQTSARLAEIESSNQSTAGRVDAIESAVIAGKLPYQTKAQMVAAGYTGAGMAFVWGDSTEVNNGEYGWDGTAWVKSDYDPVAKVSEIRSDVDALAVKQHTEHFAFGCKVLQEAFDRPVRIMMDGTSISTFDISPNRVLVQQLKKVFGDAGERQVYLAGLGGTYEEAYNGWDKQPFGGIFYHRIRGNSSSNSFSIKGYCSRIELLYSTESDGGSFVVTIDGIDYSVDCSGGQSYGNKLVADLALGVHTVTFNPPSTGYAYPEHVIFTQGRNGIEVIDSCYGGSAMQQHVNVRSVTGSQVAGIAVEGFNGVDAIFNRHDVDLVIYSGSVNDAGNYNQTDYMAALNRAVLATYTSNTPLLIQAEPAGHYARPDDPGYDNFNEIKQTFKQLAHDNAHVYVVDWDALTRIDNLDDYADRYYNLTGGTGSSSFTGDYIHSNLECNQIGAAAMCHSLAVPTALNCSEDYLQQALIKGGYGDSLVIGSLNENGRKVMLMPSGFAGHLIYDGFVHPVPYYETDNVVNYGGIQADIENAQTSDSDGDYKEYPGSVVYLDTVPGQRYFMTFVVKGGGTIRCANGEMYFGDTLVGEGADNTVFSFNYIEKTVICVEYIAAPINWIVISGRFYEGSCITQTDKPVVTNKLIRATKPALVTYPDVYLGNDQVFDSKFFNQIYYDYAGVRKELIGQCMKWSHSAYDAAVAELGNTDGAYAKSYVSRGVYRCLDRAAANFKQESLSGTLERYDSPLTGGQGARSNTVHKEYVFDNTEVSSASTMTLSIALLGIAPAGILVYFYNPSNGSYQYLNSSGTWVSSNPTFSLLFTRVNTNSVVSLTFDTAGIESVIGSANPSFRVRLVGGDFLTDEGVLDATLCIGEHAMI